MGTLRDAVNPFSTAFSRWWCHSSLRAIASGKPRDFYRRRGPAVRRTGWRGPVASEPMDPARRQDRINAIERALASDRGDSAAND
jgi:hypothetical protein